jgi:ELWxxDGT repeat protein
MLKEKAQTKAGRLLTPLILGLGLTVALVLFVPLGQAAPAGRPQEQPINLMRETSQLFNLAPIAPAEPYLVKDIYTGNGDSRPEYLTNVNGTLFFSADDGSSGTELWKSDGTMTGTVMVKDINPGSGGSYPYYPTESNGTLFFSADDGSNGRELWKSGGTVTGTVMVKDIYSGTNGSLPLNLAGVNGTLFFVANDGNSGWELWKSDGTVTGTVQVKDINPGAGFSSPSPPVAVNGTLFFSADDGSSGRELWKSDGTMTGTVQVRDIYSGTNGSSLAHLTDVNSTLFFQADDGSSGQELWKSDGTVTGTVMVKDINPGFSSAPDELIDVNGTLFFRAFDGSNWSELWKSDGTMTGTVMVKDICPGNCSSDPWPLTDVNGILFFSANDGSNGRELWKSDGTVTGTVIVKDINPLNSSLPYYLTDVSGTLFFRADDGSSGQELWKSDGTMTGTVQVKDIYSGTNGSAPYFLTDVNGMLFFNADDGTTGEELWALTVAPDLVLVKAATPSTSLAPGAPVTYTLTFGNNGYTQASSVLITDVVPITLTGISYTSSGVTIIPTGNVSYTWWVADLESGKGGIITITGIVSPSVSGVFSLTNQATITATVTDVNPYNNTSVVTHTIDAEPPQVITTAPLSGTTGVSVTASLVITFSEAIDASTFTYAVAPDPSGWATAWGDGETVVTLNHNPFAYSTMYTVTVITADDLAGNPFFSAPYAWHFTTAPAQESLWKKVFLPLIVK